MSKTAVLAWFLVGLQILVWPLVFVFSSDIHTEMIGELISAAFYLWEEVAFGVLAIPAGVMTAATGWCVWLVTRRHYRLHPEELNQAFRDRMLKERCAKERYKQRYLRAEARESEREDRITAMAPLLADLFAEHDQHSLEIADLVARRARSGRQIINQMQAVVSGGRHSRRPVIAVIEE